MNRAHLLKKVVIGACACLCTIIGMSSASAMKKIEWKENAKIVNSEEAKEENSKKCMVNVLGDVWIFFNENSLSKNTFSKNKSQRRRFDKFQKKRFKITYTMTKEHGDQFRKWLNNGTWLETSAGTSEFFTASQWYAKNDKEWIKLSSESKHEKSRYEVLSEPLKQTSLDKCLKGIRNFSLGNTAEKQILGLVMPDMEWFKNAILKQCIHCKEVCLSGNVFDQGGDGWWFELSEVLNEGLWHVLKSMELKKLTLCCYLREDLLDSFLRKSLLARDNNVPSVPWKFFGQLEQVTLVLKGCKNGRKIFDPYQLITFGSISGSGYSKVRSWLKLDFSQCKKLKELKIYAHGIKFNETILETIPESIEVLELHFWNSAIDFRSFQKFKNLKNLKKLNLWLYGPKSEIYKFKGIGTMENLEELGVFLSEEALDKIKTEFLSPINELKNLKKLRLCNFKISDEDSFYSFLEKFPNLEKLLVNDAVFGKNMSLAENQNTLRINYLANKSCKIKSKFKHAAKNKFIE